jgi:signal transduction histidine kinase
LVAYLLFSTARRVEQNQVWVGMAKETAHQLGTPLSSLIAWVEYLKSKGLDPETSSEIEKDVKRLETITERFSKIGSVPKLDTVDLVKVLEDSLNYMKLRTSKNVAFSIDTNNEKEVFAQLNIPLFEWVIENLIRNAVDAMNGNGNITITLSDQTQFVYIDIADTGKGIPKSKYKTVFEPGFTTKQRGWGLGLSLTKRIIENYHSGKIFVKSSEIDKGTTFRIVLNKV